jgi:hypothetical protein
MIIILGSIIFIFVFYFLLNLFFPCVKDEAKGALVSATVLIVGYILANYLKIRENNKTEQTKQVLSLLKSLSMFLNEEGINSAELKQQRQRFQDSYFQASLFLSKEAYNKFKKVISSYEDMIKNNSEDYDLKENLKSFINMLRKEVANEELIDSFELYRFSLKPDNTTDRTTFEYPL